LLIFVLFFLNFFGLSTMRFFVVAFWDRVGRAVD